jgi:hypothetical protein
MMLQILEGIARVALVVFGALIVFYTLASAVRTFVLPRSDNVALTRYIARVLQRLFALRLRHAETYEQRDRVMAYYAPVLLLTLPVAWLVMVMSGYTLMFYALTDLNLYEAWRLSGSSLLTLGFALHDTGPALILEFSEAMIGMILTALLIGYLPTMYSAFSQREAQVSKLVVRAGSPPSPVEMIARIHRQRGLDYMPELMAEWETWFVYVEESHTSLAALVFFRSPMPNQSWVTAAGVVLDTAALYLAAVQHENTVQVPLTIRAGFIALRRIADFFFIKYNPNPKPTDPISITREEFDAAYNELMAQGIPLKPDREQAWHDYAGWRVNYDVPLLALASLTMAPYAMWVSDRSLPAVVQQQLGVIQP